MSYHFEDIFMKTMYTEFNNDLNTFLGIWRFGKAVKELPTEINGINAKQHRLDYLVLTNKDYIIHYEFQSTYVNKKDLFRFYQYSNSIHMIYQKPILTVIISTAEAKDKTLEYNIGFTNTYTIFLISLKNMNGYENFNIIKNKINNNEKLTNEDFININFIPLMEHGEKSIDLLKKILKLTNTIKNITNEEKLNLKGKQTILVNRLVKDKKLKKYLKEEIIMSETYIQEVFNSPLVKKFNEKVDQSLKIAKEEGKKEAKQDGREEGEKVGIKKGKKEGKEENKTETAIFLLENNYDLKEICKITKLSLNHVKKLANRK